MTGNRHFFRRKKKTERKKTRKLPFPKLVDFVEISVFFSRKKNGRLLYSRWLSIFFGEKKKNRAKKNWKITFSKIS